MSKNNDEKLKKSILSRLAFLGFRDQEIHVYLALLTHAEPVGSSKVITGTGLHRQYVYNALEALEKRGLVRHVVTRGRKKFSANSPSKIQNIIQEKQRVADGVVEDLLAFSQRQHEQDFEVYQGKDSFVSHELRLAQEARDGDYLYVVGSSSRRFLEVMGDAMQEFFASVKGHRVTPLEIGAPQDSGWMTEQKRTFPLYDFRVMPGLEPGIVNTVIRPETVSFVSYDPEILCYTITNKTVAQNYKNFFEALWKALS